MHCAELFSSGCVLRTGNLAAGYCWIDRLLIRPMGVWRYMSRHLSQMDARMRYASSRS